LIYVADGRGDFVDKDTGEMNRGGLKVFVFMLEDDFRRLERLLPVLPIRKMKQNVEPESIGGQSDE
ncbi:hypothetical protein ACFL6S_35430, partial [Candidatus Poribacteria bacterium]